jgi:hypothetical protein
VVDGGGAMVLNGGNEAPVASDVGSKVLKRGEMMRKMKLNGKWQEVSGWWRSPKRAATAALRSKN